MQIFAKLADFGNGIKAARAGPPVPSVCQVALPCVSWRSRAAQCLVHSSRASLGLAQLGRPSHPSPALSRLQQASAPVAEQTASCGLAGAWSSQWLPPRSTDSGCSALEDQRQLRRSRALSRCQCTCKLEAWASKCPRLTGRC